MKKTLLLSCAMVATVAASAVTPELVKVEPLSKSNLEPVTVERKAEALTVNGISLDRKAVKSYVPFQLKNFATPAEETAATIEASYQPLGSFFIGFSPEFYSYKISIVHTGAYASNIFYNTSPSTATQYQWSYIDPEALDQEPITSTSKHLIVEYPYSQYDSPVLTVSDGTNVSEGFSKGAFYQAGGSYKASNGTNADGSPAYVYFGDTTADADSALYKMTHEGLYSLNAGADYNDLITDQDFMENYLGLAVGAEGSSNVVGLGNIFPAANHSYAISQAWIPALVTCDAGAEIKLTLYKIDDEGNLTDEVIASGTYVAETSLPTEADSFDMIVFDLGKEDEYGLMSYDPITINSAFYAEITADVPVVPMYSFEARNNARDCYSYVKVAYKTAGGEDASAFVPSDLYTLTLKTGNTKIQAKSMNLNFDACFTWLDPATERVQLDVANEPTRVDVNSYFYTTAWTIEEDADMDGVIDNAPWLVYNLGDDKDTEMSYIEFAATSVEARYADVHISVPGSNATIRVIQGNGGVKAVASDAVKVSVAGGNFNIKANAGVNSVAIYTVAGQLVKKAALVAGDNVVPASDLAKGVYVLKFNNNYAVKAVK